MKVSVSLLRRKNACSTQVELFRETFGDGEVVVTEALCVEHAQKFDWSWAALYFFSPSLWFEYKEKLAPIWDAYNENRVLIWAEYDKKRIPNRYEKKRLAIRNEYNEKKARLFGQLAEAVD